MTYTPSFKLSEVGTDFYRAYILPVYLRQVLSKNRKARILDVACGLVQVLKALRAEDYLDLSGIDISGCTVEPCIAGLNVTGFQHVEFLDPLGTAGSSVPGRLVKHALIFLYRKRIAFWNFITGSAFHGPSPDIFTFELKALVR